MGSFGWPDTDVEKLKAIWPEGLTATIMVKRFGGKYTRSAILGKAHRLYLAPRDPGAARTEQHQRAKPKPKITHPKIAADGAEAKDLAPLPQEPEPIGPLATFPEARDKTCRYPHGAGVTFRCCGHPGYPYCEFHHRVCKVRPNTNRLRGA